MKIKILGPPSVLGRNCRRNRAQSAQTPRGVNRTLQFYRVIPSSYNFKLYEDGAPDLGASVPVAETGNWKADAPVLQDGCSNASAMSRTKIRALLCSTRVTVYGLK